MIVKRGLTGMAKSGAMATLAKQDVEALGAYEW